MLTVTNRPAPQPTKDELFARYARKDPQRFAQFDCHTGRTGSILEDIVEPDEDPYDEDGDQIDGRATTELMHGAPVRVFVRPETSAATAVRVLEKVVAALRKDPDALERLVGPPPPPGPDYSAREKSIVAAIAVGLADRFPTFDEAGRRIRDLAAKGFAEAEEVGEPW